MEKEIINKRLTAFRKEMKRCGVDYYLITTADFHNSEYLGDYFQTRRFMTGFTGSNGNFVISQNEAGLWTDGRYYIQAEKELEGTEIQLFRMSEEGVPTIPEYLAKEMTTGQVLGFDGRTITAAFGKKLAKALQGRLIRFACEEDLVDLIWIERPEMSCEKLIVLPETISGMAVQEKLEKFRNEMRENDLFSYVISSLDDIMWLFNLRGNDIACNPVALSYAFVTKTEAFLFVQAGALTEKAVSYLSKEHIYIRNYHEIKSFLAQFPYQGNTGVDETTLNFFLYQTINTKVKTKNIPCFATQFKAIKNETEIALAKKYYLQDSLAVTRFIMWIKEEVKERTISEYDAAIYLDDLRRQIPGFFDLSFKTISAYQENAAMMHYEATKDTAKTLYKRGTLLVDSGAQYAGATTDVTRTIALGPVETEEKKHYSAVVTGMLQLLNAKFLYGCTGRNLDILARQPLWDMEMDYKCGTGHGVGAFLNVHEGPQSIRWKYMEQVKEAVLESGMFVTDEPGVYLENKYGIRIENVLFVKEAIQNSDGRFMCFENLTFVPIDLQAIDILSLSEKTKNQLNAYHKSVYEKLSPFMNEAEREKLQEMTNEI